MCGNASLSSFTPRCRQIPFIVQSDERRGAASSFRLFPVKYANAAEREAPSQGIGSVAASRWFREGSQSGEELSVDGLRVGLSPLPAHL